MNYASQAALIAKANKVFASDDTFLSFPVTPLLYQPGDLQLLAGATAAEARQNLQNLQSFSTLVNSLPSDEAWLPEEARYLWDVYAQVLANADFARSTRTAEEEQAYQEAIRVLRQGDATAGWVDSPALLAYRQHKDAWLLAQQRYQAARSTAEAASEASEREAWTTTEEPALRAELDALRTQWTLDGCKEEVERAQSTVVSLGARSPIQTWAEWKSRFNPDLDGVTGASDASTFYPSYFSPSNALAEAAWRPFELSASEITALVSAAPAEMAARLASESEVSSDLSSLSFEFSSALILRPWFSPDVFRSRFWRFAGDTPIVSSGELPPRGECPAYVTAVVFARKVVEHRAQAAAAAATPSNERFSGFRFLVAVRDAEASEGLARRAAKQRGYSPPIRVVSQSIVAATSFSSARVSTFVRLSQPSVRVATPQAAPAPPVTPAPAPDDSVYVLAFICKRVPLCPNPDSALEW